MEWLVYLGCGALAGALAGLFGVGGGLIIVPVLASVFAWLNLAPGSTMQLALGTSLLTIVATSLSSTRAHHRRGSVRWPALFWLAPGIVGGAWIGAGLADHLASESLRLGFGIAECLLGLYMWFKPAAQAGQEGRLPTGAGMSVAGLGIGTLSSLAGIGGGTLTVPYLLKRGLSMTGAVGTSAACGLPIALSGSLSYLFWGWNEPGLPPLAWGYLYWPAALGIVVASILCAPLGASLAHRLPAQTLKRGFAVLLMLMGAKMLVF